MVILTILYVFFFPDDGSSQQIGLTNLEAFLGNISV